MAERADNKYENSVPLDFYISKANPILRGVSENIWDMLFPDTDHAKGKMLTVRFNILTTIVFNLYRAWSSGADPYVGYSRNKTHYIGKSRYNKSDSSYASTMHVIDGLIAEDMIEHKLGFNSANGQKCSRMKASPRLVKMFEPLGNLLLSDSITKYFAIDSDGIARNDTIYADISILCDDVPETRELLILKGPKTKFKKLNKNGKMKTIKRSGPQIDYEETADTIRMRASLTRYNALLVVSKITYDPDVFKEKKYKSVDYDYKLVRRTFNVTWEHGGRYYGGWWQSVKSELRQYILMDGQPTTEIDFKSHHIVLLYSYVGIDYYADYNNYGDPYVLDGYGDSKVVRDFFKVVLLSCLNSKSAESARAAIQEKVNYRKVILPTGVQIKTAISSFVAKHPAISEYFYSGIGLSMQLADSEIAETIIDCLTTSNIPVLCMHDSFIFRNSDIRTVGSAITAAMKEYMLDSEITVKLKSTSRFPVDGFISEL